MDPVTKIISFFSPRAAAERMRSQVALKLMDNEVRKFDGAGRGRRFEDRGVMQGSQNLQIAQSIPLLRERSRDLHRNNGYSKNAIRRVGNNVVGTGILATPVSRNKNVTAAKTEEDLVKEIWKEWAESTDCDFDGMQTFYGIQKMAIKTAAKSGSCFVRRIWKKYKKGTISLELQVLDPDFLDRSRNGMVQDNGEYTFQGIQFDKNHKKIAYWIFDRHPQDFKGESKPVPVSDIAHVFDLEDPGQIDGLPFNSSVILETKDFGDYKDAQLIRQKIASCFAAFVTNDEVPLTGNGSSSSKPLLDKIQPGVIQELNRGETVTFGTPPTTEGFGEFSRQSLLGQAAGMGLSYESYTGDLANVNFSSGRMGWIEGHRNVEDWQWNLIIPMLCDRVWKWFTQAAYLANMIPDQNVKVTWTAPKREMIDPVKEGKALSELVRNGFMSWQNAVRSMGYNPEEILEEMKKDAKGFDDAKLMPECDPRYDDTRINDPMTPPAGNAGTADKPVKTKKPAK